MTTPEQRRRKHDPADSDAHVHRRKTDTDAVLHLHSRLTDCENSITKLIEANKTISETLEKLTDNLGRVAEVLEAWNNAKGFWITIKFISTGMKILLPIAAAVGAIWLFIKTGNWTVKT